MNGLFCQFRLHTCHGLAILYFTSAPDYNFIPFFQKMTMYCEVSYTLHLQGPIETLELTSGCCPLYGTPAHSGTPSLSQGGWGHPFCILHLHLSHQSTSLLLDYYLPAPWWHY